MQPPSVIAKATTAGLGSRITNVMVSGGPRDAFDRSLQRTFPRAVFFGTRKIPISRFFPVPF